jgi:molybdate transport system ATP-binding protein
VLELSLEARRGNFRLKVECVFKSEWTVIFGPSGAGKTTLLRLIAGLGEMEKGWIALDGRMLAESARGQRMKPGRRSIAMVAQQPALFPHLSVAANVGYALTSAVREKRLARVNEMLDLVDGRQLIARRPRDLSGGEAQRVALARALAVGPRLLLLDEPFSALDGAASDALLDRLQRWVKRNRVQAVLATHDATDALAVEADVALLHDGRIAAFGPAGNVLAGECERLMGRLGRA